MATQNIDPHNLLAAPANVDLSAKQFTLVKLNATGELIQAVAGDIAFSLQDTPRQGQSGTYAVGGRVKAVAGGNIAFGKPLSSDANGHLVEATATEIKEEKVHVQGTRIIGYSVDSGVAGDLVSYIAAPLAGRA